MSEPQISLCFKVIKHKMKQEQVDPLKKIRYAAVVLAHPGIFSYFSFSVSCQACAGSAALAPLCGYNWLEMSYSV